MLNIRTFSSILFRSNLAIINCPEQTSWYTNSFKICSIPDVKSGALDMKKIRKKSYRIEMERKIAAKMKKCLDSKALLTLNHSQLEPTGKMIP